MIKIQSAPREALLSDVWKVYVKQEGEKEQEVSVYTALTADGTGNSHGFPEEFCREFDGLTYGTTVKKTYFASFDADGEVSVRVVHCGEAGNFHIRPESYKKRFEESGNTVTFSMNPGEKLVVEAAGDIFGSLKLFGNFIFHPENRKENWMEFKPGYYTADNCEYIRRNEHGIPVMDNIPDDTTVYLWDGAMVCAAIVLAGKHNIRICGRGVLSLLERCYGADSGFTVQPLYGGFRYWAMSNIYIKSNCRNIEIEGIILNCEFRGIVLRNSEDITISNVKLFAGSVNADGVNMMNVRRVKIQDCHIQSADDCIAIYTACDSIPTFADEEWREPLPVSSDIEVCGGLMSTCARPFMVGGHATGNTAPHDVVENVYIHNTEVLDIASNIYGIDREKAWYWSAVFRILSQTRQLVRNITFRSIRVNWTKGYGGKPFHIEVRGNKTASYTEKGGYRIENIRFEDIHFVHCPAEMMESAILSDAGMEVLEENSGIEGVCFRDITFDERAMEDRKEDLVREGRVRQVILS